MVFFIQIKISSDDYRNQQTSTSILWIWKTNILASSFTTFKEEERGHTVKTYFYVVYDVLYILILHILTDIRVDKNSPDDSLIC